MGSFTLYNVCVCIYVCVCVCIYIYTYMELGHIFREADKSQDLQSASWRPKRQDKFQSESQQAGDSRRDGISV